MREGRWRKEMKRMEDETNIRKKRTGCGDKSRRDDDEGDEGE